MKKVSFKNRKNKLNRQGFLMIEAAFSIFIVGIILVTFLMVMGSVYRTEFAKRDLVVATNLAQEGIEIMRNIRDNNWKNNQAAFSGHFPLDSSCYIVGIGNDYNIMTPTTNCSINLKRVTNGSNEYYGYSAGTETKFSREITVSTSGDSRIMTVTVEWSGKKVVLSDTLYAWGDVD